MAGTRSEIKRIHFGSFAVVEWVDACRPGRLQRTRGYKLKPTFAYFLVGETFREIATLSIC